MKKRACGRLARRELERSSQTEPRALEHPWPPLVIRSFHPCPSPKRKLPTVPRRGDLLTQAGHFPVQVSAPPSVLGRDCGS